MASPAKVHLFPCSGLAGVGRRERNEVLYGAGTLCLPLIMIMATRDTCRPFFESAVSGTPRLLLRTVDFSTDCGFPEIKHEIHSCFIGPRRVVAASDPTRAIALWLPLPLIIIVPIVQRGG